MFKILHFSPVRKSSEIVKLHLESLKKLNYKGFELHFSFFDDNIDEGSSLLLKEFITSTENAFLHKFELDNNLNYNGPKRWVPSLYDRITIIKDKAIDFFLKNNYDYLFLTDSDLIIHHRTLGNLIDQKKDFCSSIFWTHFDNTVTFTPNAWYSKHLGFNKIDLLNFRKKGTFPVDFTGACTLLSRKILEEGVSFKKIPIINYLGEDKHFCIRASVMGYQAFVNTEYPAFHLYNSSNIEKGNQILECNFSDNYLEDWLNDDWEDKIDLWLKPPKKRLLHRLKAKFI